MLPYGTTGTHKQTCSRVVLGNIQHHSCMASSSSFQYSRSSSWSELSPSSDFYYRPAGEITSGSFRIATILPGQYEEPVRCSIRDVSLKDTSVRFLALSYCWNSTAREEVIFCDGRPLKITGNLHAALKYARASSSTVDLWIGEQVCNIEMLTLVLILSRPNMRRSRQHNRQK